MTSTLDSEARWKLHLRMFAGINWQRVRNERGEGEFPSLEKDLLKKDLEEAGIQIPQTLK